MTVTYSGQVANCSPFGCFNRILFKWRGSVYKLIWKELIAYLFVYFTINAVYRFALDDNQKKTFLSIRQYFSQQTESIPMSFVLGFYVTLIVRRWWEQYRLLPWPDSLALFVSAAIPGVDERGRLMRRNIVRYAMLSYVITLQKVSFRVKKRFPTWQHMVDAGIMMECEKKIFEMMDEKTDMSKYWMPLIWATNIINRARKEALIPNDHVVQTILTELSDIRRRLGSLIGYDTVCVPLVYTQVVSLAVYTYFLSALLGRQLVMMPGDEVTPSQGYYDLFFPFFTVLQFFFYVGWLKVAEVLINPFGEDDDDIELNWLIDRHLKAAYMIVDEMHEEHPELLKDQYWDEVVPKELPYTLASEHYRRTEPKGSAETYKVKEADSLYANLLPSRKNTADDVYADYESVDTPLVERRKNWFQRQLTRMGSSRSSTYSSGLFGRTRHNSVYASPEAGGVGQAGSGGGPQGSAGPVLQHKMSLYDRIVGRKSGRGQHRGPGRQGTTKMNGSIPVSLKNRPRIPTPDVTKEVVDREHRLAATLHAAALTGNANISIAGGNAPGGVNTGVHGAGNGGLTGVLTGVGTALGNNNGPLQPTTGALVVNGVHPHAQSYQTELPVVQVVLSPIQELADSPTSQHNSGSINSLGSSNHSHHHSTGSGGGGTAALAQAVLSPALTTAGLGPVTIGGTPVIAAAVTSTMTLTPVTMTQPLLTSLGLGAAAAAAAASAGSSPTHSLTLHTSLPMSQTESSGVAAHLGATLSPASAAGSVQGLTLTELTSCSEEDGSIAGSVAGDRSRKASVASQPPKRGEVYV